MTIENIYELLIAILPSVTAILGCIVTITKAVKTVHDVRKEAKLDTEIIQDENVNLKRQVEDLRQITQDNAKQIKELTKQVNIVVRRIDEGE